MNDNSIQVTSITGVDIELPIAGPGGRSYAFVIDWHIRVLFALAWVLAAWGIVTLLENLGGADADFDAPWAFWLVTLPGLLIYLLYHPVLELVMKGQTPGKRMAGVRIVTQAGAAPDVGAILIRNIFRLVDSLPGVYAVGLVATFVTRNQVRIGDLAAGTVLVYHEAGKQKDLDAVEQLGRNTGLDPRKTDLIQELLERWPQLQRDVRQRLARKTLESLGHAGPELQTDQALREALMALIESAEVPVEQG